ncbi:hypothetical protein FHH43_02965 [Clostridium perfringens]|nr:hypothetical protein [Clostridium perfringens]
MKFKKFTLALLAMLLFTSVLVSAQELEPPIIMGRVLEVNTASDGKTLMVRVRGYLKSCFVYEEELIAIVGDQTEYLKGCEANNSNEKPTIEKGDYVYVVLSNVFTNSIPPQSSAQKILVSKPPKQ